MRIVGVAAPLRPVLRKLNLKTGPEKSHDIRAVGKKIDRLRQSIRIGGIDQSGGIEPEFKVKRAFARCVESGKLEYDPDLIFAVYDLQKPLCIGVQRHMNAVFVNGDRLRQCAAHDRCFAFEILVNRRPPDGCGCGSNADRRRCRSIPSRFAKTESQNRTGKEP